MSLYGILDIGASGLTAQRIRVELLAQNIANAETTNTAEGGPYRRRLAVFESVPRDAVSFPHLLSRVALARPFAETEPEGVRVARVVTDPSPPERRYLPDHPDAGPDGYVEFPSFNPVEDMVDLTASVRSYQANLAVIGAIREMIQRTIDISR